MKSGIGKFIEGSVLAAAAGLLAAFGLFWLGVALHWALLPEVGMVWSWAIPGALYLIVAVTAVAMARRRSAARPPEPRSGLAPQPTDAERLGLELAKELAHGVRRHPLCALSLAMLGGAALGASPELRRGLLRLFGEWVDPETGR